RNKSIFLLDRPLNLFFIDFSLLNHLSPHKSLSLPPLLIPPPLSHREQSTRPSDGWRAILSTHRSSITRVSWASACTLATMRPPEWPSLLREASARLPPMQSSWPSAHSWSSRSCSIGTGRSSLRARSSPRERSRDTVWPRRAIRAAVRETLTALPS
ncbi:hypothetical protein PRIPAC_89144, partial [Pristionchus pacificus]